MKSLILLLSLGIFLAAGCRQQKAQAESADCPLAVHFKDYQVEIAVQEGMLGRTEFIYEYPSPQAGTPSKTSSQQLIRAKKLSAKKLKALKELILSSGFLDLAQEAYGAPEDVRFYPNSLKVTCDCKEKEVIFRSNPEYEGMPEEMKQIQAYLLDLP
jgi:hypothetical protein